MAKAPGRERRHHPQPGPTYSCDKPPATVAEIRVDPPAPVIPVIDTVSGGSETRSQSVPPVDPRHSWYELPSYTATYADRPETDTPTVLGAAVGVR